jgi:hypothetical protein
MQRTSLSADLNSNAQLVMTTMMAAAAAVELILTRTSLQTISGDELPCSLFNYKATRFDSRRIWCASLDRHRGCVRLMDGQLT